MPKEAIGTPTSLSSVAEQAVMTTCVASDISGPGAPVNGSAAPKRPVAGKTWSEVCEQVQKPDGSVRTSPPFKSWQDVTNSPPRPRPCAGYHLGKLGRTAPNSSGANERSSVGSGGGSSRGGTSSRGRSSRGGSSRGGSSYGRSSRSSSRNGIGRDGDISSQCSFGAGGWDTSTNSSVMSQEGDTPRENDMGDTQREMVVTIHGSPTSPSPSGSKGLLMPEPILAGPSLALLREISAGEDSGGGNESPVPMVEVDGSCIPDVHMVTCYATSTTDCRVGSSSQASSDVASSSLATSPVVQLGLKLKRDPMGRDVPRNSEAKKEWSPEPLAKYLKGVVYQIDCNVKNKRLPTAEKLDAFVNRLVANTHRQLRHAPKKVRHSLNGLCARRFHRYWNFARNEKVKNTTPEELTNTLLCIVEALLSEAVTCAAKQIHHLDQIAQPKPALWQPLIVDVTSSGG